MENQEFRELLDRLEPEEMLDSLGLTETLDLKDKLGPQAIQEVRGV